MKRAICIFIFLSGISLLGKSQEIISGYVLDSLSLLPLENVSIRLMNTNQGVSTDKEGYFKISIAELPAGISVSHIGYRTKTITVNEKEAQNIRILLSKETTMLPEVVIGSEKIQNIISDKRISILDYEFYENNILLLAKSYATFGFQLILINEGGTVLATQKIEGKASALIKDCLGFLHLVREHTIDEVSFSGSIPSFNYQRTKSDFNKSLGRCLEIEQNRIYIAQSFYHHQGLIYYSIDRSDPFPIPVKITEIINGNIIEMLKDEQRFSQMGGIPYTGDDRRFAKEFMFLPIYAPLFKIADSIYIFNHLQSRIESYVNDSMVKQTPVTYHQDKYWKRKLYPDKARNKIYSFYEKNGVTFFREINIRTGLAEKTFKIPESLFIENIKINNGHVYFIYWNNGKDNFSNLYKMNIN